MTHQLNTATERIERPKFRPPGLPTAHSGAPRDPALPLAPPAALFARLAAAGILLVVLAHLAALYLHYTGGQFKRDLAKLFLMDWEANFATFFNFSLFVVASASAGLATLVAFRIESVWRWHWAVLSAVMLLLSFDEASMLHETLIPVLRRFWWAEGPLYFAWVVPGAIVSAVFGLSYLGFLRALPRRVAGLMLLSGICYLSGAIGVEMIGATLWEANGGRSLVYELVATVEEVLEMSGLALFSYSVLCWLSAETRGLRWSIGPD